MLVLIKRESLWILMKNEVMYLWILDDYVRSYVNEKVIILTETRICERYYVESSVIKLTPKFD